MSRYSFSMPSNPGRQGWFRVREVEVTTTALLCGLAVVSMVCFAISPALLEPLYYASDAVRAGQLWRVATWPLANPPDLWTVIAIVFFWFIGHLVEDQLTRNRFLGLILATTIIPALLVSLIPFSESEAAVSGLSGLVLPLFVVVAVQQPEARSFFGIPIWVMAAVFVAVQVLFLVGVRAWAMLLLMLTGIGVACVVAAAMGLLPRLSFVPQMGESGAPKRPKAKRAKGGRRGSGTVTAGPWAGSSAGPTRLEAAELDVLLDKISQSGVKSLTKEEQRRLDELSRKMRGS